MIRTRMNQKVTAQCRGRMGRQPTNLVDNVLSLRGLHAVLGVEHIPILAHSTMGRKVSATNNKN